jgi:hypothetical protein
MLRDLEKNVQTFPEHWVVIEAVGRKRYAA